MADHHDEEKKEESLMEKASEKFQGHDSSSSDDEDVKKSSVEAKAYRLFGREKSVHKALGGGILADVFLWRDKKVSAGVLGGATAIWVLFDVLEFNLLTLVCYGLILALVILFLWSNASTFIKKSPPCIPDVNIPEKPVLKFASALRIEINCAFSTLREIASGRDLKKFLSVIAGLWILSLIGSCCDFLTLAYTSTVLLCTVPVLYEKYEDKVDSFAEKAMAQLKKQYAVLNEKVLSKIPRAHSKDKKRD
ncbi:unnamed protein product [Fraxinus pennsylvanica]|uniref:Reticulon domain-containing protein n=1 Tax=Fraxinus pennsylvanica TaxID=56036 RepID=A0AAD1ZL09_9LAMI|nr:unnamed protein product [Fraxinus pennsylvanica]